MGLNQLHNHNLDYTEARYTGQAGVEVSLYSSALACSTCLKEQLLLSSNCSASLPSQKTQVLLEQIDAYLHRS